jgi:hypothetical protein
VRAIPVAPAIVTPAVMEIEYVGKTSQVPIIHDTPGDATGKYLWSEQRHHQESVRPQFGLRLSAG